MKLGFSTWAMPDLPIDATIKHLSKIGYDGITIAVLPMFSTSINKLNHSERKRILNLSKDQSLPIVAVMSFASLMETDTKRLKDNIALIKQSIELATHWETPYVITGIGGLPGDLEDQEKAKSLRDVLQELAIHAERYGITIALEAHVDQAAERPAQLLNIIKEARSENIKANFDISHFNVQGIKVKESVELLLPVSVLCDVKDEIGIVPDWKYVAPGDGNFDYVDYLKIIDENGYQGFVTIEISFMVQNKPSYDPIKVATKSYKVLDKAFKKANIKRG